MLELVELIPTLGFPIVCCMAIGYMFYQMLNKILVDSKERENNLMNLTREISTKIAELGQIVDKNTEAISVLNEKIAKLTLNEKIAKISEEVEERK